MTIKYDPDLYATARELGIDVRGYLVGSAEGYVSGFEEADEDESDLYKQMKSQPADVQLVKDAE